MQLLHERSERIAISKHRDSLVHSPEVLAILKTSLHDFNLTKHSTFADVLAETRADDPQARFKLGHTDPNSSTSGLFAVLAEFTIAAGKSGEALLTAADVESKTVQREVEKTESRIAHYVDIGRDFNKEWCNYGHLFADGAYMQETTLREFDEACPKKPLVAIYPQDAPYRANYPYVVLTGRGTSDSERRAAERLGDYVDEHSLDDNCKQVVKEGFRKAGCHQTAKPRVALGSHSTPTAKALDKLGEQWREIRRPATVMLVLDASVPMEARARFESAKAALVKHADGQKPFVECMNDNRDRFGLVVFGADDAPQLVTPVDEFDQSSVKETIKTRKTGNGPRRLYDAMLLAQNTLNADGMTNPERINTIVLMTSGGDELSERVRGRHSSAVPTGPSPSRPGGRGVLCRRGEEVPRPNRQELHWPSVPRRHDGRCQVGQIRVCVLVMRRSGRR